MTSRAYRGASFLLLGVASGALLGVGGLVAGCGEMGKDAGGGPPALPDGRIAVGNGQLPIGGAAASVFDESYLHDVELTMSAEDWQSIVDDSRGDEWRHATVRVDDITMSDVGVRPSGESSRIAGNPKMSIKLKFNAFRDQQLAGLKELKLDGQYGDPSLLRQRIAYFVLGSRMPAPRQVHARVVVNGQLRGVYGLEEVWENDAIKDRFATPAGPLYRITGATTGDDPYAYKGADTALYVPFPWKPQNKRAETDTTAVASFCEWLPKIQRRSTRFVTSRTSSSISRPARSSPTSTDSPAPSKSMITSNTSIQPQASFSSSLGIPTIRWDLRTTRPIAPSSKISKRASSRNWCATRRS